MYCSSFQASKKAQPPLPSWFSASLNSVQRTSKIYGSLGEGSEAETEPHFREWRRNLTGWLASSSFTFITFVILLANLLACGDNPKSLTHSPWQRMKFAPAAWFPLSWLFATQCPRGRMIGNLVWYGRKSANFIRPSLRITPSSSMQELSFIN